MNDRKGERYFLQCQVKSRQRVINHGEVFTAEREVKAMCDLVNSECVNIYSRFLEPACGEGNFLIEVLTRKLASITDNHELNSIIALSSLYGIDILADNVEICRERLFNVWHNFTRSDSVINSAKFILSRNIVCGDTLSMKFKDGSPIIFPEWTFDGCKIIRRDFYLAELIEDDANLSLSFENQPVKEYQDFRNIAEGNF